MLGWVAGAWCEFPVSQNYIHQAILLSPVVHTFCTYIQEPITQPPAPHFRADFLQPINCRTVKKIKFRVHNTLFAIYFFIRLSLANSSEIDVLIILLTCCE